MSIGGLSIQPVFDPQSLLRDMQYSLQSNRKTEEGDDHPDRDAQFRHINSHVRLALKQKLAVISVDTKKKELIGNYDNAGQQWLPAGQPIKDEGYDFPPGTSKWNKIEHRLFSFTTSNWRGEPLLNYETIVNLIAKTTTAKELKFICKLDRRKYPTERKITDVEMKQVNMERDRFHGEWNYVIKPNQPSEL